MKISRMIMDRWLETDSFNCVVRLTDDDSEISSLDDLGGKYFAVGTPENTVDVPFIDMLAIVDAVAAETTALKMGLVDDKVKFQFRTEFSDEDAARIINSIGARSASGARLIVTQNLEG